MGVTLQDVVEMAIDNIYNCYVWDNEKETEVFRGMLSDIPDELLEQELMSWEIEKDAIGFNIN